MKIFNGYIFKSKNVIISEPPLDDKKKVVNIYVEPETGKLVVIHEK